MAITYTISREQRLIRAFATGIIRADDLHGLIKSLLGDPGLLPGLRGLYDARYAEPDITVMQLAFRDLAVAEAWLDDSSGTSASGIGTRPKHPQN